MTNLKGIGASRGVGIGPVLIMDNQELDIDKKRISSVELEFERVEKARLEATDQLNELKKQAQEKVGEEEAQIFAVHQMMLADEAFLGRIKEVISEEEANAEYAVSIAREEYAAVFAAMDDAYMKERAADIRDIANRLIRCLLGPVKALWRLLLMQIISKKNQLWKISSPWVSGFSHLINIRHSTPLLRSGDML